MSKLVKQVITILSEKGGIGKTKIIIDIADTLRKLELKIKYYDNDSGSPRLSKYKFINAEHIQLHCIDDEGHVKTESLNINRMDVITDELENGKNDIVVIDNGSSSFQPFLSYFQVDTIELFKDIGVEFIVIIPFSRDEITRSAAIEVLNSYGTNVKYILIENEHFGEFDYDAVAFDKAKVSYAIMKLKRYTNAQMEDFDRAQSLNLLLDEAIKDKQFNLVSKSRLNKAQKQFQEIFNDILNELK